MIITNLQDALARKFERQKILLEKYQDRCRLDCGGTCLHSGNISPGCGWCFSNKVASIQTFLFAKQMEAVCNFQCPHCFETGDAQSAHWSLDDAWRLPEEKKKLLLDMDFSPYQELHINFSAPNAEPLLYMSFIREFMLFYRNELLAEKKLPGFAKLYTNGFFLDEDTVSRLRDFGIDEVRVNPTASGFSGRVYANIGRAVGKIPVVTVETPLWPHYRDGLFQMLPIIEDLGVNHLNLDQIEIRSSEAFHRMAKHLPVTAQAYIAGRYIFVDDEGLAEELIDEVLAKRYSYSVLDCSALVHTHLRIHGTVTKEMACDLSPFGGSLASDR